MEITKFVSYQREQAFLVGDYGTYRKKLSRRLLVVRKKLGNATKGRKYTTKAPITAQVVNENIEYAHLLLLSAERAWAQAMQVRTIRPTESSRQGLHGSTRKYIISRLYRATTYAEQLLVIARKMHASQPCDDDVLEAAAYVQSLSGSISFEKNQWEKALQNLSEARFFYSQLSKKQVSKATDVFAEMMSSSLDPNIRYAAYQLGLPRTTSIEAIVYRFVFQSSNDLVKEVRQHDPDALKDPSRKEVAGEQKNVPKTITWRKRTVNIEDAATAQALATVSAAETELSSILTSRHEASPQSKAAEYDRVLIPSQDAVDATKTAIEELTAEGVVQGDPRMQALQITRTAVNYALVGWRIGRNRILCGPGDGSLFEPRPTGSKKHGKKGPRASSSNAETKPTPVFRDEKVGQSLKSLKERVVLYDAILQSLDAVKDLPGVAADQPFLSELASTRSYFAALRCLAIARSHALLGNNRESLALLSRALDLSTTTTTTTTTTNPPLSTSTPTTPPNITITPDQRTHLHTLLQNMTLHHRALIELQTLSTIQSPPSQTTPTPFLVSHLHEYPSHPVDLTRLVKYPPALEAIPVKPIFLDLAYNYIEYPSRRRRTRPSAAAAQDKREREEEDGEKGGEEEVDKPEGSVAQTANAKAKEKDEKAGGGRKGWFGFGR